MMPFQLESIESLPDDLSHYRQTLEGLIAVSPVQTGVACLTIDEKELKAGNTLRTAGLHVDSFIKNRADMSIWAATSLRSYCYSMWNENDNRWFSDANKIGGMVMVSSPSGCRAWNKSFIGKVGNNGNCEHLRTEFPESEGEILEDSVAYWCNASCVHESLPMEHDSKRTFVRLSMPSHAPWFEGYTKNPKGIKPSGNIIPLDGVYGRAAEPEVILKD